MGKLHALMQERGVDLPNPPGEYTAAWGDIMSPAYVERPREPAGEAEWKDVEWKPWGKVGRYNRHRRYQGIADEVGGCHKRGRKG